MTTSDSDADLLVIGLGNLLCGDDGLGVVTVDLLRRRYQIPSTVRVLDGGTLGLALLSHVQGFDEVILVDAIRAPGPAGSFVRLEGDEVAPAVRNRLSVHQIGVADLLDGLRWLDAFPHRLVLLGLVPDKLEFGLLSRSPAVERQIPPLVERIVEEARDMGYLLRLRRADETIAPGARDPAVGALGL